MSAQVQLSRARSIVPASAIPVQPVPIGVGPSSEPQITLSPDVPANADETRGISFFVAGVAGTFVEVWKRESGSGIWALLATFTNVPPNAYAPFKWMDVCDVDASELFFVTDATGIREFSGPGGKPIIYVEETST